MKRILFVLLASTFCYLSGMAQTTFSKKDVLTQMKKVADWQIAHQKEVRHGDLDWTNGALYVGMTAWAKLAEQENNDDTYFKWLLRIGSRNHWQVGQRMYHADDIAVAQMNLEMYRKYNNKNMINPTIARTDWVMKNPSQGSFELNGRHPETLERWTWCDALFMAPPVYTKLYRITGDKKYIKFMNKEYKDTYDYLFDKEENLFFRDWNYFNKKEANGKKVFWGRGNGWVVGGLAEILKELPRKDKNRKFYEELFITMCNRLKDLQSPDGYWHASLLDPASYPSPETSASGFIVYALAYGINEGLLPADTYLPAVEKGWKSLVAAVEPDGKLGYVQPIGADPKKVTRNMTEVYGVGAFLLAGTEIYKMSK